MTRLDQHGFEQSVDPHAKSLAATSSLLHRRRSSHFILLLLLLVVLFLFLLLHDNLLAAGAYTSPLHHRTHDHLARSNNASWLR